MLHASPKVVIQNKSATKFVAANVAAVAAAIFLAGSGFAATSSQVDVKQALGGYADNAGQSRTKAAFDVASGSYAFGISRERVTDTNWRNNKYLQTVYGEGVRLNDSWSLGASRNFDKLTDTRIAVGGSSDGVIKSQNFGAGVSRWMIHETFQAGLDVSRSIVDRPEYEILDFDATVLTAPSMVSSSGATVTARHLSTPTTMTLASAAFNQSSDRPLARFYQAGVRQYVPVAGGAVHGTLYRGLNQGSLSTKTLYGEVNSWATDLAWIQELGRATQVRAGWRVYQERETGRAYQDETQFGSDLFSLGIVHDVKPDLMAGNGVTVEAGIARYFSNKDLMATTANFGVSGKF